MAFLVLYCRGTKHLDKDRILYPTGTDAAAMPPSDAQAARDQSSGTSFNPSRQRSRIF